MISQNGHKMDKFLNLKIWDWPGWDSNLLQWLPYGNITIHGVCYLILICLGLPAMKGIQNGILSKNEYDGWPFYTKKRMEKRDVFGKKYKV